MATKKIKISVSQREYANQIGVSNEAVGKAIRAGKISKGYDEKTKKIFPDAANVEWGNLHRKVNISELIPENDSAGESSQRKVTLNSETSYADARRIKEVISAQLLTMELQEKKGQLVSKDAVLKELFAFGQIIRLGILTVPDRHIDNILASTDRVDAYNILYNALADVLEELTTKKDFQFTENK